MPHARKLLCILLGALMLMGALSGCAGESVPEEGRLVLNAVVCGRLDALDPAYNTDPRAESVYHALYENLLRMDDDGTGGAVLAPGTAKEYQEIVNFDGTVEYVFTLRSAARWSDGTRVKAKDFVFAWQRLVDPGIDSPNCGMLSMVQGYDAVRATGDTSQLAVKAEGDTTFRVTLAAPCPYFLSDVCTAVPTMPLRSDVTRAANWAESISTPGNGAYRPDVWARGEYIQLRRSDSYYESRSAGPDLIRFRFAASAEEAWQLYEEGLADYVASPPERAAAGTGHSEDFVPLPLRSTTCVLYNHMGEAFSNAHVRAAFDLTLDRAALAAAAGAAPATGLVPPGIVDGAPDALADFRTAGGTLCAVDEEGYAQRCLDAEYEMRVGGYWGGAGFPAVTCLYAVGEETHAAAFAAAANWRARLGVSVTIEGVSREELDSRLESGEYDLAIDSLAVSCGDAMDYLAPFSGAGGDNKLHYASTPFDLLIGVAASSRDPSARAAFLHDAEALLLGDTALSPICFGGTTYVLREGFEGVWHDAGGCAYFAGVRRVGSAE